MGAMGTRIWDELDYLAGDAWRLLHVVLGCQLGLHRWIGFKWPAQCRWCERYEP